MLKTKQTPGSAISAMLEKFKMNYNRLAKAIGISSAMVRLIARDENPISAPVAFRLAKFFNTTPEYWLKLQTEFDIAKTAADKKLAVELKEMTTADKFIFVRKKKTVKTGKLAKVKKPAAKKALAKTAKRGKPASVKPKAAAGKKGPAKKAAGKTAKPVAIKQKIPAKVAAPKKTRVVVKKKPAVQNTTITTSSESGINEPQI